MHARKTAKRRPLIADDRVNRSTPVDRRNSPTWGPRVYAIAFDLDTDCLRRNYHNPSWENAYADIGRVFARFGFHRQQGSVYFGDTTVTPVTCVLAVQAASAQCTWLKHCVQDIRMLRIEENNDLYPALGDVGLPFERAAEPDDSPSAGTT